MANNEVTQNIRDYLFGGKAEFTLEQEGTIQVKYKLLSNENRSCYFVYTECLASKEVKYQGYIVPRKGKFYRAKQISDDEYNSKAINALGWLIRNCDRLPNIVHVYHNGKCSRCGRKLTDAESLRTGLGPYCRQKGL